MTPVGHMMILASAGSGKTYQLTNRFVKLLAGGAPPDRIVALTFTRKAAGEFFDEILTKLAAAASEPVRAAKLAAEIGEARLEPADFLRLLRAVTDTMHRLSLGTIDSFFARIVRNFPLELGLGGEFEILQESAAQRERRRVLQRMFQTTHGLTPAQRSFVESFKRATFGAEEKRLGERLEEFIEAHQEAYLAAPEAERWGNARRIWPQNCPWLVTGTDRATAAQTLQAALPTSAMDDKQRGRWAEFFANLADWHPGAPLPGAVEYIIGNALEEWPDLMELRIDRKKVVLPEPARAALQRLVTTVIGAELTRRLEMTRGIHAILEGYDAAYDETVRQAGRLTFADVQRLLAPATEPRLLASDAGASRRLLDFRLDARFEHWLLDEFQDTSFGQWSVLRDLIDEVVQDPTGARSFFYVGDVKQAIFAWREGDPRLVREIFDYYNRATPEGIREQHLDCSYRSGPAVITTVNRVLGAANVLRELFPAAAVGAWMREWRDHDSARPELGGHAALLQAPDEEGRFAVALEILREIKPLARGLSCAVLVQRNETAARLAEYLRREGGMPALAEADLHVCIDNPLGAALLALCKAAAHPGDTLAREHVRMTPLEAVLTAEGLTGPDAFSTRLLGEVHDSGFERTMESWLRRLEPQLDSGDIFSRERAVQFAAAARLFDETGSRDVREFIRFMEDYSERESESATVVRVMTIHKAKGLGFDLVLLPDLEGYKLDRRREGLAVQKARDRSVEWVMDLPPRLFCEADKVLAAHIRASEAEACYEKLSVLYVALTRARRAMYLIVTPPGTSKSNNYPKLIARALSDAKHGSNHAPAALVRVGTRELPGTYAEGDAMWHTHLALAPPEAAGEEEPAMVDTTVAVRGLRLPARRPADAKRGVMPGAALVPRLGAGAAEFGTAVHALFASVEWWTAAATGGWISKRRGEDATEEALTETLACLNEPTLAPVFSHPGGRADVWRERAFEVVLDHTWVTGVIDRVVIERGTGGRAVRAAIFDFKTDRLADISQTNQAVERFSAQLNLYRRVVAVLTELALDRVSCDLVLTNLRRTVRVPWPT